jgi:hypothetical protein
MAKNAMAMQPNKRPDPGPMPGLGAVLRVLAVLDAIVLQSLGLFWVSTWPGHGGLFGAVVATLLLWWAIKRAGRALFAFDEYRWFARHLVKLALVGLILQLVVWLQRLGA